MRRGAPLQRKTPLAPGKPLTRSAPIKRAQPIARTTQSPRGALTAKPRARTTRARTGPTDAQRALVFARDHGRCARCGIDLTAGTVGYNDHHRQGRGMGGRQGEARERANSPANRLTLCGSGTTLCHGWVTEHPAEAERDGMVVRRGGALDPARVPILTHAGWVLHDHDGDQTACPTPPEGDARNG